MKRNIAIAAVTAAVLVGGGAVATAAFADDDDRGGTSTGTDSGKGDDGGSRNGSGSVRQSSGTVISVDAATAAALRAVPGTVTDVELDDEDDDDRLVWELDVYGSDKVWHDVTVDAYKAKVLTDREDDDDDRDRHAPRSAAVSLDAAVDAALAERPGTVTSVELDHDDDRRSGALRWDVDIEGKDGRGHELTVDARNAKVTVDQDDDGDDDHDD